MIHPTSIFDAITHTQYRKMYRIQQSFSQLLLHKRPNPEWRPYRNDREPIREVVMVTVSTAALWPIRLLLRALHRPVGGGGYFS